MEEMIKARAALVAQMSAFMDAHTEMNDDQVAEYTALEAEYEKIQASIIRAEKQEERQALLSAPTSLAILPGAVDTTIDTPVAKHATPEYKQAFDMFLAGQNMQEYRAEMTVGTDADGGYIVPEEYQRAVIMRLNTLGRTRGISRVITTNSTTNFAVEGDAPTFTWINEGGTYGTTKATFGGKQMQAWKLGGIIKVSEELLQDNMIDFDAYMGMQIARGIDKAESPAFAVGDGASKPTGYAFAATVGPSSTTAGIDGVTADEMIDIYYDLKEEYRATATWRMTDKTEKYVRKLKDGNGNYLWSQALSEGERPSFLGRPIVIDNSMAEMGTGNKFVVIGDFMNYQISDRGSMSIQRLDEKYADEGYVGFKVMKRVDAKPMLDEAFNAGKNA